MNNELLNQDNVLEGAYVTVRAVFMETTFERSCYLAHQRFRDPKIAILTDVRTHSAPSGARQFAINTDPIKSHCTPYGIMQNMPTANQHDTLDAVHLDVRTVQNCTVTQELRV